MEKTDLRPRFDILDGLRGVAALLVIWYHFFEGFATSPMDQMMNHGYLAVDFFFVLSGFVIGYAYDGRWKAGNMTFGRFMLRRVIRLHPMVVLSVVLGAVAFLLQGSVKWDGTPVSVDKLLIALVLGLFLIPVLPGADGEVRGNGEMFPLNGPSWSLFFEYIGSILYGLILHRLGRRSLAAVVVLSAAGLACCALGNISGAYHLGVGWTMADMGFVGGFFRLSFSFSVGLLLTRSFRRRTVRGAFWICAALIAAAMACPYVGGSEPSAANAIYDLTCTIVLFPVIVYIGACGTSDDRFTGPVSEFMGRMSYPIYIIHYPVMYLFYSWVWANALTFDRIWWVCLAIFAGIILMAFVALKYYDEPIRRYLSDRFLNNGKQ